MEEIEKHIETYSYFLNDETKEKLRDGAYDDGYRVCSACSGSGVYDNEGSPACGGCEGEGICKD